MKAVIHDQDAQPLPDKHLAILFEGAWLFTQDPDDRSRVLAICPYNDADDHVCEFGRWDDTAVDPTPKFVGPNTEAKPLLIAEASQYRVELSTGTSPAQTFTQLFEGAAKTYPFIYLKSRQKGHPLSLTSTTKVRKISIPMPDEVRPAGQLLNTPIVAASSSLTAFELGIQGVPVASYVTFVFLYLGNRSVASVTMHRLHPATIVHTQSGSNLHLIFRVHGTPAKPVDSYTDHVHLVSTFDSLRKLVQVPQPAASSRLISCDFGMFPSSGDQIFHAGDTGLSTDELGLGKRAPDNAATQPHLFLPVFPTAFTLASCAGGAIVANGGDTP